MSGENYVNYYIDTIMGEYNKSLMETLSLKTNARISQEVIDNLTKEKDVLIGRINQLEEEERVEFGDLLHQNIVRDEEIIVLKGNIEELNGEIIVLKGNISELNERINALLYTGDMNSTLNLELIKMGNDLSELREANLQLKTNHDAMKELYDNSVHQLQHLGTFRDNLANANEEILKLRTVSEEWQNKYVDILCQVPVVEPLTTVVPVEKSKTLKKKELHLETIRSKRKAVQETLNISVEDGGSF